MGKNKYRDIYSSHFGKIPPNWHVHHIDHFKRNSHPSNLMALPICVHARVHNLAKKKGTWLRREECQKELDTLRWFDAVVPDSANPEEWDVEVKNTFGRVAADELCYGEPRRVTSLQGWHPPQTRMTVGKLMEILNGFPETAAIDIYDRRLVLGEDMVAFG